MSEYDATLFDMDGVTVQTARAWRDIERQEILPAALESGAPEEDVIRALSVDDAYDRLASHPAYELTVDRSEFSALYESHAEAVYRERATLLDGFEDLLSELSAADHAIGLVSASRRAWVEMVLDRFDLQEFDVVVGADSVAHSKPAPDPYLDAAAAVGVDPTRAIAIEDSPHGIESATNAGMDCIALRGAGNADLDLSRADTVVDGPSQLRETLQRLA